VLLAVAAWIRERGDRPGIPALRAAVDLARASLAGQETGSLPAPAVAAGLAAEALSALAAGAAQERDRAIPPGPGAVSPGIAAGPR
jgi:hypothetical protein